MLLQPLNHRKQKEFKNHQKFINLNFQGWTVTLAGTYQDDMAPEVEMRLSFPKTATSSKKLGNRLSINAPHENESNVTHQSKSSKSLKQYLDNGFYGPNETDSNHSHQQQPALLPPPSNHFNPKRTLSRNHYSSGIISFSFI